MRTTGILVDPHPVHDAVARTMTMMTTSRRTDSCTPCLVRALMSGDGVVQVSRMGVDIESCGNFRANLFTLGVM